MAKQINRKSSAEARGERAAEMARRERGSVEELLAPLDAQPGPARRVSPPATAALVDSILAKVFADA